MVTRGPGGDEGSHHPLMTPYPTDPKGFTLGLDSHSPFPILPLRRGVPRGAICMKYENLYFTHLRVRGVMRGYRVRSLLFSVRLVCNGYFRTKGK